MTVSWVHFVLPSSTDGFLLWSQRPGVTTSSLLPSLVTFFEVVEELRLDFLF